MSKYYNRIKEYFELRNSVLISSGKNCVDEIVFKCCKCEKIRKYSSFSDLLKHNPHCLCKDCLYKENYKVDDKKKEIVDFLKSKGSSLLSEYINSKTPLKYSCARCGKENHSIWNWIQTKNPRCLCKGCSKFVNGKLREKSRQRVSAFLEQHGLKLLEPYISTNHKIHYVCPKCNEEKTFCNFQAVRKSKNFWCKECTNEELGITGLKVHGRTSKITTEEVSEWFKQHNSKLIQFTGAKDPVIFECVNCHSPAKNKDFTSMKTRNPLCFCRACNIKRISAARRDPNLTDEDRKTRRERFPWYGYWCRRVYRVYKGLCCISGEKVDWRKKGFVIHHLQGFTYFPELRTDVANGVVLKKEIHNEFHDKYGRHHNTLEQFKAFFKEKTGRDFELPFSFGTHLVTEVPGQLTQDNRIKL